MSPSNFHSETEDSGFESLVTVTSDSSSNSSRIVSPPPTCPPPSLVPVHPRHQHHQYERANYQHFNRKWSGHRPPRDSDIPNCSCFYLFSVRAQHRMETFYNTKLCKLHKKSVERSQKPYQLILRSQTFLYFSNFEIKIIFLRVDFLIWGVCETHPRHCLILIFGKLRNTFSSSRGARGLSNWLTESKYINRVSLTRLKILVWLLAKSIVWR